MSSRFCISNYEPVMFDTRREFLAVYHGALLNLIGKTIDGYLLLYDERDNEWNKDAPAILIVDGRHYEDPSLAGIEFMVDKATADGQYSFLQIYNDTDEIGIEVINDSEYYNN